MSFIVRIFFSGLVAFVPSSDDQELTVLLIDAQQGYAASDHSAIECHKPLLLARAARCSGQCSADPGVAKHLFPTFSNERAGEMLALALDHGAAWGLSGAELALRPIGQAGAALSPLDLWHAFGEGGLEALPDSPTEREDFRWIADMADIDPEAGVVDPDVLAPQPKKGLIAARLKLRAGRVVTYRLVGVGSKVTPLQFRTLSGDGAPPTYSQALAHWVAAEIEVKGESVELLEQSFGGETRRSIQLAPAADGGRVEMALLNIPANHLPTTDDSAPGRHFELYYELSRVRPPTRLRPIPHVGLERTEDSAVEWSALHPPQQDSELLNALQLGDPRGIYSAIICPVAQFSAE